jgi:hypothetical protein
VYMIKLGGIYYFMWSEDDALGIGSSWSS